MSDQFQQPDEEHHQEVQRSVAELVRLSLIQLSDMNGVNERLHTLGERLSKITDIKRPRNENPDADDSEHQQAS